MKRQHYILEGIRVIEAASMVIEGAEKVRPGLAPELGGQTRDILKELGYPEEKIQELSKKGVVFV